MTTPKKGDLNGECNRKACTNKAARSFNHSTSMYYCKSCADTINTANFIESMELFGHELCTETALNRG